LKPGDAVVIFTPDSRPFIFVCVTLIIHRNINRHSLQHRDLRHPTRDSRAHYQARNSAALPSQRADRRGGKAQSRLLRRASQAVGIPLNISSLSVKIGFLNPISSVSFDPVYSDAKARAQTLGEFNFFNAWMSQPKSQLETFRAWAGKDSDIR